MITIFIARLSSLLFSFLSMLKQQQQEEQKKNDLFNLTLQIGLISRS